MKRIVLILVLLPGMPLLAQEPPPEILQEEIRELQTVLQSLRAENERLRRENRRLQRQLQPQAPLPSSPPPLSQQSQQSLLPDRPASTSPQATKRSNILYINPHWHYLIASAGSDQGLAKGNRVQILRNETVLGTAVVTEVKPGQAVLNLNTSSLTRAGVYPAVGDQISLP